MIPDSVGEVLFEGAKITAIVGILMLYIRTLKKQVSAVQGTVEAHKQTIGALQTVATDVREHAEFQKRDFLDARKTVENLKNLHEAEKEELGKQSIKAIQHKNEELAQATRRAMKEQERMWGHFAYLAGKFAAAIESIREDVALMGQTSEDPLKSAANFIVAHQSLRNKLDYFTEACPSGFLRLGVGDVNNLNPTNANDKTD